MDWMATSNQSDGTISGAALGSLTYYHEEGHLEYIKKPIHIRMSVAEEQFKTLALFFIVIGVVFDSLPIKIGALIAITFSLFIHAYEEVWAWLYAYRNRVK